MKRLALLLAVATALGATAAMRPTPDYLKRATVYQIVLRNFTRDGNFRAAAQMLDHVRSIGVDVVYLAPFVEMDCDMDEFGWSDRQKRSGFGSPKNSYRISNYDRIDPEYGKDDDFKAFNDKAHSLGMKVYMDLVNPQPMNMTGRRTFRWGCAAFAADGRLPALMSETL
ncbi:MAG: alpha-amylase family glycosyl hydrolase [Kiritimatiellia bacterium]